MSLGNRPVKIVTITPPTTYTTYKVKKAARRDRQIKPWEKPSGGA